MVDSIEVEKYLKIIPLFFTVFIFILAFGVVSTAPVTITNSSNIDLPLGSDDSSTDLSVRLQVKEGKDLSINSGVEDTFKISISVSEVPTKITLSTRCIYSDNKVVSSENIPVTIESGKKEYEKDVQIKTVYGDKSCQKVSILVNVEKDSKKAEDTINIEVKSPGIVATADASVKEANSIVGFFEILNKKLLSSNTKEVSDAIGNLVDKKEAEQAAKPSTNSTKTNKFVWKDVLRTNDGYNLEFPKTTYKNNSGQLSILFKQGAITGIPSWVVVSLDGTKLDCTKDEAKLPALWGSTVYKGALVFEGGEGTRTCENRFGSEYIANVSVTKGAAGKYDVTIESILIPDSCTTASNNDVGGNTLKLTC